MPLAFQFIFKIDIRLIPVAHFVSPQDLKFQILAPVRKTSHVIKLSSKNF